MPPSLKRCFNGALVADIRLDIMCLMHVYLPHSDTFQERSTNGVLKNVVAAVDGLFVKAQAPTPKDTANVLAYYSGSKSGYGLNVQAMCTADYRFSCVSAIAPGATNDWVAWDRSALKGKVNGLPKPFHIIGDAAYPISDQLLTPYPGKRLPPGEDSFNFHLSQLRVNIEQSFGILVGTWGMLWRPLRVQFRGRDDLVTALFHLHNFLRDENVRPVHESEEDVLFNGVRPQLTEDRRTLPPESQPQTVPAPSRSGESPMRAGIRGVLEHHKQWRPDYNVDRNS